MLSKLSNVISFLIVAVLFAVVVLPAQSASSQEPLPSGATVVTAPWEPLWPEPGAPMPRDLPPYPPPTDGGAGLRAVLGLRSDGWSALLKWMCLRELAPMGAYCTR